MVKDYLASAKYLLNKVLNMKSTNSFLKKALVSLILLTSFYSNSQTFTCDATSYISTGSTTFPMNSQLFSVDRSADPFTFTPIGNPTTVVGGYPNNFVINALAYNPVDNFMYAVVTNSDGLAADPTNFVVRDIVRIDSNGLVTRLGNVPSLTRFIAGAFLENGDYVIGGDIVSSPDSQLTTIDVNTLAVINDVTVLGIDLLNDIAVNPQDPATDRVYFIDEQAGFDIVRWANTTTGAIEGSATNTTGLSLNAGSQFFDSFGNLYFRSNDDDNLYKIDMDAASPTFGVATLLTVGPAGDRHDGATCAFDVAIEKTVSSTSVVGGNSVTYTYRISNPTDNVVSGLDFIDDLDDARTFVGTSLTGEAILGGTVNAYDDTNLLTITGFSAPANSITTLTVQVSIPAYFSGIVVNQAQITGLSAVLGTSVVTDDPDTPIYGDSTSITVTPGDSDGDGIDDLIDIDDDNDGIPDITESGGNDPLVDGDGDGWPFYLDDNDAVAGIGNDDGLIEAGFDTDGDLIPNYLDTDSDGDGIYDLHEAGFSLNGTTIADGDANGMLDGVSADFGANGLLDAIEVGGVDGTGIGYIIQNTDFASGDTQPDFLDIDDDGDGVNTIFEGSDANADGDPSDAQNTDSASGDTVPDYLDVDDDGDGVDTIFEGANPDADGNPLTGATQDTDTDATFDYLDIDDDGDGVNTEFENPDPNNDGDPADAQNTDSASGDTVPDYLDRDDDGDGINTDDENPDPNNDGDPADAQNSDAPADAIPDYLDTDDDNDGILTSDEDFDGDGDPLNDDNDGDGVPNYLDLDSDNDGVPDSVEGDGDSDGDGIPDYLDLDSDNDGISDIIEAGGIDTDGDGQIDYPTPGDPTSLNDANNNGLDDTLEATPLPIIDTDGDGIPNNLDVDSDNDGITDARENGGPDADGDGEIDTFADGNDNGISDALEGVVVVLTNTDADTGDTLPNYLDLDSDADGISDIIEAGGVDIDGDGHVDYVTSGDPTTMTDADSNGLADAIDPGQAGTALPVVNTDGTGGEDYLDIDADGDGIVDNIEGQTTTDYIAPAGTDVDNDGLDDNYDGDDGNTTGVIDALGPLGDIVPTNTDGMDSPDYIDTDSDNDGDLDALEGWDTDNNGTANIVPSGGDADGDGLDNAYDVDDSALDPTNGDTLPADFPNLDVTPLDTDRDWREGPDNDSDNDGVDDAADLDDDNDGIPDTDESGGNDPNGDEDGDGIPNYLDTTDDGNAGDGSTTDYTDLDGNGIPDVYDGDGDGVPNHLDLDSDNDGIYDIVESGQLNGTTIVDANNDGILDAATPASVGANGLLNLIETNDTATATVTIATADSDTDGIPDSNEINADNDGCNDVLEAGFTDTDSNGLLGTGDVGTGLTVDVNGLVTSGTDGYTTPLDGDTNGIFDFQEVGEAVALTTQPIGQTIIINASANFDVTGTAAVYQWQESTNGGTTWNDITNGGANPTYSGATTDVLTLTTVPVSFSGNQYRVILSSPAFACDGDIISDEVVLNFSSDNDDDSIPDFTDLDDDNDGILDIDEGCDESLDIIAEFGPLGTVIPLTANSFTVTDFSDSGIDFRFTEVEGSATGFPLVTSNNQTAILASTDIVLNETSQIDLSTTIQRRLVYRVEFFDSGTNNPVSVNNVSFTLGDVDGLEIYGNFSEQPSFINTAAHITIANNATTGDYLISDATGISNNTSNGDVEVFFTNSMTSFEFTVEKFNGSNIGVFLKEIKLSGFCTGVDTDGDGVLNHLDLDSDNDGIYDVIESGQINGTTSIDADGNGVLDGATALFGANGVLDAIENAPDSGILSVANADSDNDGILDAYELNSDGDGCSDVLEAGFTDVDGSGRLGNDTGLAVDANGLVTTGTDGYTTPLDADTNGVFDFQEVGAAVTLTDQPMDQTITINSNANFDVTGTAPTFQWQESTDSGVTWNNITDGGTAPTYAGTTTDALTLTFVPASFSGNQYRVILSSPAFACDGNITSNPATLTIQADFDGDGIGDPVDLDDDNDGIPDLVELNGLDPLADADGDGVPAYLDDNDNNISVGDTDGIEAAYDLDGDGDPNHLDLDADGDGIYDVNEGGFADLDADDDGVIDGVPADFGTNGLFDGLEDAPDSDVINYTPLDTDNDGIINVLDVDDDGDGINTENENPVVGGGPGDPANAQDTDGDGVDDYLDIDDDNDGILTATEGTANSDTDAFPNYLDQDSDGDGIADNVEGQSTAGYIAPDGVDTDGDGLDDAYDNFDDLTVSDPDNNGATTNGIQPEDSDSGIVGADGNPDYIDDDSDGDTVPDSIEGHDLDNDGVPDNFPTTDADNDGLNDAFDGDLTGFGDPNGAIVTTDPATDLPNTDSTEDVNYRDIDDDGDGIHTRFEDLDGDGDFANDDTDGDGIPNYLDNDDDGDGLLTADENPDPNGDGNPADAQDNDSDGTPDYLDDDDDNDGISTLDEDVDGDGDPTNDDSDGDGIPNYLDIDDDGDGIMTIVETDNDEDDDTHPNYLDLDSDDDGIPDNVEGQTTSGYIVPDGVDTDNDGLDDAYDNNASNTAANYGNTNGIQPVNTDASAIINSDADPDYLDTDSDGDTVPDSIEGHNFNAEFGPDIEPLNQDVDMDGLDDAYDSDLTGFGDPNGSIVDTDPATDLPNFDGVDEVNYRDVDDDNDGIDTADEDGDMSGDSITDDCDEDGNPNYVDVIPCDRVPSGFSPNGDDNNDTFIIPALDQYKDFTMQVYDRYGNIVYDYDNAGREDPLWWDGFSTGARTIKKGDKVPVGTYYYIINFNEGRESPIAGWVYVNY